MDSRRSHRIVIATIVATSLASVALGPRPWAGSAAPARETLLVSSTPAASTVLLLIGILVIIELQWSHVTGRRSSRAARASVPEPAHA